MYVCLCVFSCHLLAAAKGNARIVEEEEDDDDDAVDEGEEEDDEDGDEEEDEEDEEQESPWITPGAVTDEMWKTIHDLLLPHQRQHVLDTLAMLGLELPDGTVASVVASNKRRSVSRLMRGIFRYVYDKSAPGSGKTAVALAVWVLARVMVDGTPYPLDKLLVVTPSAAITDAFEPWVERFENAGIPMKNRVFFVASRGMAMASKVPTHGYGVKTEVEMERVRASRERKRRGDDSSDDDDDTSVTMELYCRGLLERDQYEDEHGRDVAVFRLSEFGRALLSSDIRTMVVLDETDGLTKEGPNMAALRAITAAATRNGRGYILCTSGTTLDMTLSTAASRQKVRSLMRCLHIGNLEDSSGYGGATMDALKWFSDKVWPNMHLSMPETRRRVEHVNAVVVPLACFTLPNVSKAAVPSAENNRFLLWEKQMVLPLTNAKGTRFNRLRSKAQTELELLKEAFVVGLVVRAYLAGVRKIVVAFGCGGAKTCDRLVQAIRNRLEEHSVKPVQVQGIDARTQGRQRKIDMFQRNNEDLVVLVASMASTAAGVNLHEKSGNQRFARHLIMSGATREMRQMEQMAKRFDRVDTKTDWTVETVVVAKEHEFWAKYGKQDSASKRVYQHYMQAAPININWDDVL